MAIFSVTVVSGANSLTDKPSHMTAKSNNQGDFQLSTPVNSAKQTLLTGPNITIWYGSSQDFGFLGNPQPMINILGNVSDPDGIGSLEYSLNGGAWSDLSWKETTSISGLAETIPGGLTAGIQAAAGTVNDSLGTGESTNAASTNPRLVSTGDFNIEIDVADLNNGSNTVTIRARDNDTPQNTTTKPVTVNYTSGQTWPMPYTADWSDGPTNVAQIVDGEWAVVGGRLRPVVTGYDRVVAIGELQAWDDFEVRVPVTIYALPVQNSGGVGIVARWQGHFVQNSEQPGTGWWHIGAYGYYRNRDCSPTCPHFALRTSNAEPLQVPATLNLGVTYNFKMRAQTKACGGNGLYSFKVWEVGDPEPASWIFEVCDNLSNAYDEGSVLLVAHKIDVSFGDVAILPVLDVNVSTTGNGSVDVDPLLNGLSDAYIYGDPITLTATADPGWIFNGWSGDLSGNTNPLTLTLSEDLNATANFVRAYDLDLDEVGNGVVDADPSGPEYAEGTTVTLTATADPGWSFVDWSGDLSGSANPTTLVMNGDKSVTATFSPLNYTIDTSSVNGSGAISKVPDKSTYTYGEVVTLTAIPEARWSFANWAGDLSGSENPTILTVTTSLTISATFLQDAYSLDVNVEEGGSVTKEPDQANYLFGDVVTVTAVAHPGWTFIGWGGDLSGSANPTTLVMNSDKAVTANFEKVYALDINLSGNGTVTVEPDQPSYSSGQVVTLTATADPGWTFTDWSGDLSGSANPTTLVLNSDKAVIVTFEEAYTLDINPSGNGIVTVEPDQPGYSSGQVVTLTATADPGWSFVDWSDDLSGSANPTTLVMDSDKEVTANFEGTFTLDINLSGNGTVTVEPDKPVYASGEIITLTAVPDPDWNFLIWEGGLTGTQNPISITVTNHMVVTAYFGENTLLIPLVINADS